MRPDAPYVSRSRGRRWPATTSKPRSGASRRGPNWSLEPSFAPDVLPPGATLSDLLFNAYETNGPTTHRGVRIRDARPRVPGRQERELLTRRPPPHLAFWDSELTASQVAGLTKALRVDEARSALQIGWNDDPTLLFVAAGRQRL